MCRAKSPIALFSMFMYIMHGTFAIPECKSTLHHLHFRCKNLSIGIDFISYSVQSGPGGGRTKMWDFWHDRSCQRESVTIFMLPPSSSCSQHCWCQKRMPLWECSICSQIESSRKGRKVAVPVKTMISLNVDFHKIRKRLRGSSVAILM